MSLKKKSTWAKIKDDIINKDETSFAKAKAIGFGFFMGIFPVWGFQLLIGIPLAVYFKMNKALFITAANISVPPMIPVLVFVSYYFGQLVSSEATPLPDIDSLTLESIHLNVIQYYVGAVIFAVVAGVSGFLFSFIPMYLVRKK